MDILYTAHYAVSASEGSQIVKACAPTSSEVHTTYNATSLWDQYERSLSKATHVTNHSKRTMNANRDEREKPPSSTRPHSNCATPGRKLNRERERKQNRSTFVEMGGSSASDSGTAWSAKAGGQIPNGRHPLYCCIDLFEGTHNMSSSPNTSCANQILRSIRLNGETVKHVIAEIEALLVSLSRRPVQPSELLRSNVATSRGRSRERDLSPRSSKTTIPNNRRKTTTPTTTTTNEWINERMTHCNHHPFNVRRYDPHRSHFVGSQQVSLFYFA